MPEHLRELQLDPGEPEEDAGTERSIHLHRLVTPCHRLTRLIIDEEPTGQPFEELEVFRVQVRLVVLLTDHVPPEGKIRQQLVSGLELAGRIQPTAEVLVAADEAQLSDHILYLPVLQVEVVPLSRVEPYAARHASISLLQHLDSAEAEKHISADLHVVVETGPDHVQRILQLLP